MVEHVADGLDELPPQHRLAIQERCEALLKVITDDLEMNEAGQLVIVRRRTPNRIVSITDPDARSGRKSKEQPFKGFKLNVIGDLLSGLIVGVQVFPGHLGEGLPGVQLLARAQLLGLRLQRVLADSAYGGTPVRLAARALGVEMVAPPPGIPKKKGQAIQKHEFAIDFDLGSATCPAGHTTSVRRSVKGSGGPRDEYRWPYRTCRGCPLRENCAPKIPAEPKRRGRPPLGKRLLLHSDEQELRAARADWAEPAIQKEYRRRGEGESLIARMVRYGARQARAFGLANANLQAHAIAMTANIALLARRLLLHETPLPHPTLPLFPDTT